MIASPNERSGDNMFIRVRQIISNALQLGVRLESLERDTPLLGNLPELDSMAVVTVITALEEDFGFIAEDDDELSSAFETLGDLTDYVEGKIRC